MTLTFRSTIDFRVAFSHVLPKILRLRTFATGPRGDYGDSLATPVNHSGLRNGDARRMWEFRSKMRERARDGGQSCGPERDERRERVRRRPSMSGGSRHDSRGFLAIFNGFSTEPPRVRTRCGFIAGEVCYRTPYDDTRRGRVIHESKLE